MAAPNVIITPEGAGTVSFKTSIKFYEPPYPAESYEQSYTENGQTLSIFHFQQGLSAHTQDIDQYVATATANEGYVFDHWVVTNENVSSSGTVIQKKEPTANPLVTYNGGDAYVGIGTQITTIAGHTWVDNCTTHFEAVFKPVITLTVTTAVSPVGKGETSGDGEYTYGQTAQISTERKSRLWKFSHWEDSDGNTYEQQSFDYTVEKNITFTAFYERVKGDILCDENDVIVANLQGEILHGDP